MTHAGLLPPQSIRSRHLGANRTVRLYLPPSYFKEPSRRYPVLYVHDGQNVFSSAGANDDTRFNNYAAFLTKELKPHIDGHFRTLTNPRNTAVMGSSLGGICSLVLAWENPKAFGSAASLSGSFQIERSNFLTNILQRHRGKPKPIQIYIDSGVIDFTGDDDGRRYTDRVVAALHKIGWRDDVNLKHFTDEQPMQELDLGRSGLRHDKWKEAQSSQHNEFYWRMRAWRALTFLFPP